MKPFLLLLCLIHINVFAQSREQLLEEYMRERNKMMEEIMKMFNEDMDDMLKDDFFNSDIDSFFSEKSILGGSSNVAVEQKYEKDGSISIIIIPKHKNVQLDISTENQLITIKSEVKVTENSDAEKNFKSISSSSMMQSITIPEGYTAKTPTAFKEGIKISLVPSEKIKDLQIPKQKSPKDNGKVPVTPKPGEEII